MPIINVKGHEFNVHPIRDSYDRRALQFKNNIIAVFRKIGLTEDDVEIELETNARKIKTQLDKITNKIVFENNSKIFKSVKCFGKIIVQ